MLEQFIFTIDRVQTIIQIYAFTLPIARQKETLKQISTVNNLCPTIRSHH